MRKSDRVLVDKIQCLRRAIINSIEHRRANDPPRIYSQYIRYALDEFSDINRFISKEAMGLKRSEVINEHVVPHKIVMEKLLALNDLSDKSIFEVIEKYYIICTITKDEDKKLNDEGLRMSMPINWNEGRDGVYARYAKAGIEFVKLGFD